MKSFIVALCVVGCVLAVDRVPEVLRNEYKLSPETYSFAYETDNGIVGQASGTLKVVGKDQVGFEVTGANAYTGDDGKVYDLTYVANENGYQPKADFLPTPPAPVPIPEYIARAIAYTAAQVKKA